MDSRDSPSGSFHVRFFGTTTLLIHFGHTAVLTDGFFTRPPAWQVAFGKIRPDPDRIKAALLRASLSHLDAVLVGHSHYDHALDAPEVARQTGALLVGSNSSAQIGLGWGLPSAQIRVIQPGVSMDIGELQVTFLPSQHCRPVFFPGLIQQPLIPPARSAAYREGGCFSILISNQDQTILVQESAGFLPGALSGRRANTVFLSAAQLSWQSQRYIDQYLAESVLAVQARRVIPIHWDNFQKALGARLEYIPP